jgi:hypothetical protein
MPRLSRSDIRKTQPSVLDTFDPARYRPAFADTQDREGGGKFGTMTREHYLELRAEQAAVQFTNPEQMEMS